MAMFNNYFDITRGYIICLVCSQLLHHSDPAPHWLLGSYNLTVHISKEQHWVSYLVGGFNPSEKY